MKGTSNVERARCIEFTLTGPEGEPVDLRRTFRSHGLTSLPPMRLDENADVLELTVPVDGLGARTVRVSESRPGNGMLSVVGPPPGREELVALLARVRCLLRLDEDLSRFYSLAAGDPELSWVTRGAGRIIRGATVFEDVIKTLCTTNCSWSATTRMVSALVEHLGGKGPDAPETGSLGRAFPTA